MDIAQYPILPKMIVFDLGKNSLLLYFVPIFLMYQCLITVRLHVVATVYRNVRPSIQS